MKLTYSFLTTVWLCLLACSDSPTGPEKPDLPDPRQFTWTIDTLAYPGSFQTLMYNIWGSSPDNVYAVGHNFDAAGRMYHYNGDIWRPIRLSVGAPISLTDIHGFSAGDIWVVGSMRTRTPDSTPENPVYADSSLILHLDGSSWRRPQFKRHHILETIWGSAPDDIWAGGVNGALFHYDGESWEQSTLPFDIPFDVEPFWSLVDIAGMTGHPTYAVLLARPAPTGQITSILLEHQSDAWAVVDSLPGYPYRAIWMSPEGILYSAGVPNAGGQRTVSSWQNGSWQPLITLDDFLPLEISGTGDNDIFVVGGKARSPIVGKIIHYNGINWYEFEDMRLPDVDFSDLWTNGSEIFILGHTFNTQLTVVLHGK